MAIFQDKAGNPVLPIVDEKGRLPLSLEDSSLMEAIDRLWNEVRLLRLGLCAAPDAVCVDLEGELTPVTTSEE